MKSQLLRVSSLDRGAPGPSHRLHRGRPWLTLSGKALLMVAVVGSGLWTVTKGLTGVAWSDVFGLLAHVGVGQLALLALTWFGGLTVYATVLAVALPGLGMRRGLLLNLTGSAVANVVPMGGAVATGLNLRMTRRWGHSDRAFVAFCVLTNELDVVSKLLLPLVGVVVILSTPAPVSRALWLMTLICVTALGVLAVVHALLDRVGAASIRLGRLHDSAAAIRAVVRRHWARLAVGSVGYVATQVLLLDLSLRAVGLHAPLGVVLTAAGIERLGTLFPLTPGGAGVAELGVVAYLLASGLDPVSSVGGVLLYRTFLLVVDIPVGGVLLAAWLWLRREALGGVPA